MTSKLWILFFYTALLACQKQPIEEKQPEVAEPVVVAPPTPTAPEQIAEPTIPEPGGALEAARALNIPEQVPVKIPEGYQGKGVLAKRTEKLSKKAPAWAKVVAEIIEEKDKRFLRTSGYVKGIHDIFLAKTTAENRARQELARWLNTDKLEMSQIAAFSYDKKKHTAYAQAQIEIPADWLPGKPIITQ